MVTSDDAKTQAAKALEAAGIKRDRVEFFTHKVSNFWTRGAGPRFLSDGRRTSSSGRRSSVCSPTGAWFRSTRWT